jgi:integrase
VGKPRGSKNGRSVRVYDPSVGKKVYCGTRYTLKEARVLEREMERKFAQSTVRVVPTTVAEWVPLWLQSYPRPQESTRRHNAYMAGQLVKRYGTVRLDAFTRREAYKLAKQSEGMAKVAAAMFSDAIFQEELFAGPSPFAKLGLAKSKGRADCLMLTEREIVDLASWAVRKLGSYGEAHFRSLILFAAYSGLRPAELFGLRWTDLDYKAGTISVVRQRRPDGVALPKEGRTRLIALPNAAREALMAMGLRGHEVVFITPSGTPLTRATHRYYWATVRIRNGEPELAPYELRHLCGSLMADKGLSARDIAHHLGNSERVCERVYLHTYAEAARARVQEAMNAPSGSQLGSHKQVNAPS